MMSCQRRWLPFGGVSNRGLTILHTAATTLQRASGTWYCETSLIRHSMGLNGLKNHVGLGGCWIIE